MYTNFLKIFKIILISSSFFILIDSTAGKYVYKKYVREQIKDKNINFSETDLFFHHKFPKNFDAIGGWGNLRYKLCTDSNRFRTSCDNKLRNLKKFDIGIIGDSFTEGLGFNYEKTFVGLIEKNMINKKVANLGMSSYSPSIYLTKIKKLISEGYEFKEVIVFLDLSDLADDVLCYEVKDKIKVIGRSTYNNCYNNFIKIENNIFRKFIERHLKFTNILIEFVEFKILNKKKNQDLKYLNAINHSRSEWTYNYRKELYNNYELIDALEISKKHMLDLSKVLKENSIDLSIAIYPWPGTIRYDKVENLQVKTWRDFCINNCNKFYNLMPYFFSKFENENFYENYKELFIDNDFHFNEKGNEFLAENFLLLYNN